MEDLHSLLHSLSRAQIRVLRNYLTCFSSRGESDAKTLHLVEILLKSEASPSIEDCSQKIYGLNKDSKILKLKSRLKAKILDSIVLDINLSRADGIDQMDLAVTRIKKKLTQFHILYNTYGSKPIVKQLLDEIIQDSKLYEYYSGVVEGLRYKKYFSGFRIGEKEFDKINKQIEFYKYCYTAASNSNDHYYKYIVKTSFNANPNSASIQKYLRESIAELKKDYDFTKSPYVGYYLKQLEFIYFSNNKNYNTAREVCIEMLAIVNNNASVYRKQRVGIAYDNIAQCDIYLGEYSKASRNAQAAQNHFNSKSTNFFVSKEIEFHAMFYNGEVNKAKAISKLLLKSTISQPGNFRYAKYYFFNCIVLFSLGDFKNAVKWLNQRMEISKDKVGWEVAVRILTILSHIELGNYDMASQLIEGARRHLDRQGKVSEIKERDRVVIKILQLMSKRGFAQEQVTNKEVELLRLLASNEKKHEWEPLTPELIPFHQWATQKYRINLAAPTSGKQVKKAPRRRQMIG